MSRFTSPTRRGLLVGLTGLVCAPAIVRVSSLMPVKAWVETPMPLTLLDYARMLPSPTMEEVAASLVSYRDPAGSLVWQPVSAGDFYAILPRSGLLAAPAS